MTTAAFENAADAPSNHPAAQPPKPRGHAEITPPRSLHYDTLVIAIGSITNDFGTPGVSQHAIPLETPEQAVRFNHRLVNAYNLAVEFEQANETIRTNDNRRHSRREGTEVKTPGTPLLAGYDVLSTANGEEALGHLRGRSRSGSRTAF